jgi:hypothetical protein
MTFQGAVGKRVAVESERMLDRVVVKVLSCSGDIYIGSIDSDSGQSTGVLKACDVVAALARLDVFERPVRQDTFDLTARKICRDESSRRIVAVALRDVVCWIDVHVGVLVPVEQLWLLVRRRNNEVLQRNNIATNSEDTIRAAFLGMKWRRRLVRPVN